MNFKTEILTFALSVTDYENYFQWISSGKLVPADYDTIRLNSTRLNRHRTDRIMKSVTVPAMVSETLSTIKNPVNWIVITEPWCGDSAQNLPYLIHLSTLNPLIRFSLVLRDSRPEIMDLYLTNGVSRSIPILVALDEEGTEMFRWGPRPAAAQELFNQLKSSQMEKEKMYEELHLWYGRNKGLEVMTEIAKLIKGGKER